MMTRKNGKIVLPDGVLVQDLDAKIIMLNINTQFYHGLNNMGAHMWKLLFKHGDLEPVVAAVTAEYDVQEATVRKDLNDLVQKLLDRGLIAIAE